MKAFKKTILLIAIGVLTACGDPGGGGGSGGAGGNNGTGAGNGIVAANIVGAKSLLVAEGDTGNEFLQITNNGDIEPVEFTNEDDEPVVPDAEPEYVYNVGEYVVFMFDHALGLLTRKADGAVYVLTDTDTPELRPALDNTWSVTLEPFQADAQGNIYYSTSGGAESRRIVRVTVDDAEAPVAELISPANDDAYKFVVSGDGHVIYTYFSDNTIMLNRLLKADGGLSSLSPDASVFWTGPGQHLFIAVRDELSSNYEIEEVIVESDGEVTTESAGTIDTQPTGIILRTNDLVFMADNDQLIRVNDPTATPVTFSMPLSSLKAAVASDNFIYLAGQQAAGEQLSTVLRVDPTDPETFVELYSDGAYDVDNLVVNEDDEVTAAALRLSDGDYVVLTIDASGAGPNFPTVVTEDSVPADQPVVLECIANCGP